MHTLFSLYQKASTSLKNLHGIFFLDKKAEIITMIM